MSETRDSSWIRPLMPALLTVLIDLLGFGIIIPLSAYYPQDYHASDAQVMYLAAVYSLAQFLFQPMWGALSDRIGRRPVMLFSVLGTAICLGGYAWGGSLTALFVWRFLNGACAANISTAQAMVADLTTSENRAKGMGMIGASFGLGFTLGPVVGGLMSHWGHSVPIWFASGLAFVNFVWAFASLPESRPQAQSGAHGGRSIDPRALLRGLMHPVVGLCIAVGFCATFAFSLMETSFGLVAKSAWGLTPEGTGAMLGVVGILGMIIQGGLIGRLVKRFGEPSLVLTGIVLNAIGLASMGGSAVTGDTLLRWVGVILIAIGSSIANPSLSTLISRGIGPEEQGAILGANQSLLSLARALSPFYGAWAVTRGVAGGFLSGSALLLAAVPLALPAVRRAYAGRLGDDVAAPGGH